MKKKRNKKKRGKNKSAILQNAEGSENKSQERKRKRNKTEDPRRISSSELLLQIFVLDKGLRKPKF
jgi:hypothetical protein